MKENSIVGIIKLVALVISVFYIIEIISVSRISNEDGFYIIIHCIYILSASALIYGFSYVVDAACRYIDKCNKEDIANKDESADS